ncbi:putative nuclease HARBI1 [Haliotis asinina]|uniref:putative nuclease HARBI1 n=1 Tax=Haliotis asinina TaxID=109174 RepID=UPI003531F1AE
MAANASTDRNNILEKYTEKELTRRFRLSKDGIQFVVSLISNEISPLTQRSNPLSATEKVLLTLRYLATGKMQLCNADHIGVSQSSVSRAITQTITAVSVPAIVRQFISFPTSQAEIRRNQLGFYGIANFPGVVGVIDGTHIQILAPSQHEPAYVNRKQYHSINTQVIFDHSSQIIDVVAKWPGSTHDSRILTESGVCALFTRHVMPAGCHLLGDSGYPCRDWLLTPYLQPHPGSQTAYNRAHKRTRSVVERGIGQLKRRFHVLHGEVRLSPQKTCKVITSCAVLHNICKMRNIPLPDGESMEPDEDDQPQTLPPLSGHNLIYRDHFANTHF